MPVRHVKRLRDVCTCRKANRSGSLDACTSHRHIDAAVALHISISDAGFSVKIRDDVEVVLTSRQKPSALLDTRVVYCDKGNSRRTHGEEIVGSYSYRNASIGSSRDAFQAG